MKKQYVYSFDGDYYDSDLYDKRKEAINAGIKEAKKEKYLYFYLGTTRKYEEDCGGIADTVIEYLKSFAENEVGEAAEGYMNLTKEEEKILDKRLRKVVLDFQKEFKCEPDFYNVSDVEVINLIGVVE
jgi:hypothetical protein